MSASASSERRDATVWIWSAVELAVLLALAIVRAKLWTYGSDTGTFAQIVGDALRGMRNGVEDGSHFRYHWSPSLALLWPLVAATRSALPLQFAQAFATVACAPLVSSLARPYLGPRLARALGILTLLYPPLLALGFDEFHELGLFTPLALALVVSADRRRWIWFYVAAAVAIGLREDAAITLIFLGLAFVTIGVRPRVDGRGILELSTPAPRALAIAGTALAVGSAAALAAYYGIVTARLGGWVPSHFYTYPFASGPLELVLAPLTHPLQFFPAIFTFGRLTYVLEALVPLAFLPLRSRWSLLAIPGGVIVLLANSGYVWRMGDHYAALWIPWLLVATVMGVASVGRRAGERAAARWTASAVALCVLFLIAFDPLHPLHYLHPYYRNLSDARRAIACVPATASLSTHDEWFSAIAAERPLATIDRTNRVEYLVYDDDAASVEYRDRIRPALGRAIARGEYRVVCRYGGVSTFARAHGP